MKKIIVYSLILVAFAISGAVYLGLQAPDVHAATQRFYADPDDDGHGTPNEYIVRDDSELPPEGYINWISNRDKDNCPDVYNPNQDDANKNGIGDACDSNQGDEIELLDVNLNKIALLNPNVPDDFYMGTISYPTADFDASNYQVRPAHTLMLQTMRSYYKTPHLQDYSVSLRLYDSILDAKAIFDKHNTQHTRDVLSLSSLEKFGDDVFCHHIPATTGGTEYYICGLRYVNLFVLVQADISNDSHTEALEMLRSIYTNTVNYNSGRVHPTVEDNIPPLDTSNKLPDLMIEKIYVTRTTQTLTAAVKNDSDKPLTQSFFLRIIDRDTKKTWDAEFSASSAHPLQPFQSVRVKIAELPNGIFNLDGTVDPLNEIPESDELNNTRFDHVNLDRPSDFEVTNLRDRIKDLYYTISKLEREIVEIESALVERADTDLTKRLRGRILLQVEEQGEAWYVDEVTGQKFYLKDGGTAYQALKVFGLGAANSTIEKIPVGFEDRFADIDSDGDGLSDKTEEALGTDMNNPDSDGDGFSDGDEVRSNYDPLGTGALLIDTSVADSLRGKILLQVEGRGQAWYIHPDNGKRYYLKDGPAAYQIMRYLSLGITNADLRKIDVGSLE